MNLKKLGMILILGGIAAILLSIVWFMTAYADTMDFIGQYGGADMGGELMACLYSSPAICQGASFLSDAPSYSPVVFWIGVIALAAGVIVRLSLSKSLVEQHTAIGAQAEGGTDGTPRQNSHILGFIPEQKYTRTLYILMLTSAVGSLFLSPLVIIGLAGFALGLLGLFVFKPQLNELDINHLVAISIVYPATAVLLLLSRGSFFFLLAALAQTTLFYIGFNSFRYNRIIEIRNLKNEARLAMKPISQHFSSHERH